MKVNPVKAARYHFPNQGVSPGSLQIDAVDAAPLHAGEVRVRVAFAGICGSDLARYRQLEHPAALFALLGSPSPTPGHEFSGTVESTGIGVPERWADGTSVVGSRVVVHPQVACGECAQCRAGYWTGCARQETIRLLGLHRDGGFAEFVNAPFDHLVRLPERLSLRDAALAEPLAVALHSLQIAAPLDLQAPVAVIGDGVIGLLTAHLLVGRRARHVTLVGRYAQRMAIAASLGVSRRITPQEVDPADHESWPTLFLTAGSQTALELAFAMTARGGKVVTVGYLHEGDAGVTVPLVYQLIRREKSLIGSCGSTLSELTEATQLLADGKVNAPAIIGRIIDLDSLAAGGFDALIGPDHIGGKILVTPSAANPI